MVYSVANVDSPLDSVAQMCDQGATVVFIRTGGYVTGGKAKVTFERRGDTYIRKTWVRRRPTEARVNGPFEPSVHKRSSTQSDRAAMEIDLLTRPTYADIVRGAQCREPF